MRRLGNYTFEFDPPLDPCTDELDLIDAVALQRLLNQTDPYQPHLLDLEHPQVQYRRKKYEAETGHLLFSVIDGGGTPEQSTKALEHCLGMVTNREAAVAYVVE